MNSIKDFCKRWLASWTGNVPEQLIQFYDEEAYYQDPGFPQGLRGRASLLPYFKKLLARYPDWIWEAEEIFPSEKGFLLKWKARLKKDSAPFYGLDIVELKNGKIIRNEVYFDPAPLRQK